MHTNTFQFKQYAMSEIHFDEAHLLHELKHYLPSQTPLKDFVHHNTLHAFQHTKFYDGIFKASTIFGYHVTLELEEYRNLYKSGRIKDEILNRIITEKKGVDVFEYWKNQLLIESFCCCNKLNNIKCGICVCVCVCEYSTNIIKCNFIKYTQIWSHSA